MLGVCVRAGHRISLFWRETHTKGLTVRSLAGPEVNEERKVREKKEGHLTKGPRESSRQRRAEEDSQREIAVQGKDCQQKEAVREDNQR